MSANKVNCVGVPPHVQVELVRIEKALGSAKDACQICYDEGDDHPWRISDQKASESYTSVEHAIAAAPEWRRRHVQTATT